MPQNNKHKILFAEDDPPVRKLISEILSYNGFDVLKAEDGQDAINIYKQYAGVPYDAGIKAIVSDLHMPNVNGEEFAKYNYENKNLPFVVCTAYGDAKRALSLLKYGVQDYVVKPIMEDNFIMVVNNVICRAMARVAKIEINRLIGNVGFIDIKTRQEDIYLALDWVGEQVKGSFSQIEKEKYLDFISEFLINAYEHGNMEIGEKEKSQLLEEGIFESETKSREVNNDKMITVAVSVLDNEIALNTKDEGDGFNYKKYLKMTEDEFVERLEDPVNNSV